MKHVNIVSAVVVASVMAGLVACSSAEPEPRDSSTSNLNEGPGPDEGCPAEKAEQCKEEGMGCSFNNAHWVCAGYLECPEYKVAECQNLGQGCKYIDSDWQCAGSSTPTGCTDNEDECE